MAIWSLCSIFSGKGVIEIESTEEINMGWLAQIYGEKVFRATTIQDGIFKSHDEYHAVTRHGAIYPHWVSTINMAHGNELPLEQRSDFASVEWQIIHYLLDNGWEPFSNRSEVEGNGVGTGLSFVTCRLIYFRKQVSR